MRVAATLRSLRHSSSTMLSTLVAAFSSLSTSSLKNVRYAAASSPSEEFRPSTPRRVTALAKHLPALALQHQRLSLRLLGPLEGLHHRSQLPLQVQELRLKMPALLGGALLRFGLLL